MDTEISGFSWVNRRSGCKGPTLLSWPEQRGASQFRPCVVPLPVSATWTHCLASTPVCPSCSLNSAQGSGTQGQPGAWIAEILSCGTVRRAELSEFRAPGEKVWGFSPA